MKPATRRDEADPRRKAAKQAYRATPRAKILHSRRQARIAPRKAATPERAEALRALIAAYDRELARIDHGRQRAGGSVAS